MKRVDSSTGQLIGIDEIRKRLNASIPDSADIPGYPAVVVDPNPVLTAQQDASLGQPWNDNGVWRQSWTVTDKSFDDVTINRHQAKIVLLNHGLLDQVNTLMESADPAMVIAWTEAPSFRRNSPTLLAMATALNLTESEVDALFAEALAVDV
jgi:hypothetical protein